MYFITAQKSFTKSILQKFATLQIYVVGLLSLRKNQTFYYLSWQVRRMPSFSKKRISETLDVIWSWAILLVIGLLVNVFILYSHLPATEGHTIRQPMFRSVLQSPAAYFFQKHWIQTEKITVRAFFMSATSWWWADGLSWPVSSLLVVNRVLNLYFRPKSSRLLIVELGSGGSRDGSECEGKDGRDRKGAHGRKGENTEEK